MSAGAPFGFGTLLTGRRVPADVQMPDGLPVSGGGGSPLVDAFLALQGRRIKDAVTAPRDALSGDLQVMGPDGHPTEGAMDRAGGLAGLAMTGSMPFKAPAGAVRSFGGAAAHGDPLAALEAGIGDAIKTAVPDRPHTMVDPAAGSWDLYHGTAAPADFDRFRVDVPRERGRTSAAPSEAGALFLSPAAGEAAHYAGEAASGTYAGPAGPRIIRATVDPGRTDVLDIPHMVANDPGFVDRARAAYLSDVDDTPFNRQMFDTHIDRTRESLREHAGLQERLRQMGYPEEPAYVPYAYGMAGAAVQTARERGLDTAVLRGLSESNGGDQVVALTPGRVRSHYDPDHLLYSGGPLGVVPGLGALATSSDPKGSPVSAGLIPFGTLSPADIARLLQQARPQDDGQGDAVPVAPPPGYTGFNPPSAPTMQPPAAAPAPQAPSAPAGAPLRMFGSLAPQMPAPPAQDAPAAALPSLVGSRAPAMTARAAPQAPENDEAPTPVVAPARPLGFGALPPVAAPAAPATTGSVPAAGTPSPAPAPVSADGPSIFDRVGDGLRALGRNGGGDLLTSLGIGLMSKKGLGAGAAAGLQLDQAQQGRRAATELAQAEYGLKARKLAQETAALGGNAGIIKRAFPNLSDAEAIAAGANGGQVTEALKILRDPNHGRDSDPAVIKMKAQAQAEGSAAGSKDDVQIITRPDGSIVGVNKSRVGEADGPSPLMPVAPATGGARVWGTTGADGRVIEPPPGTPAGTPGAYDEKGMPHVALTQGTNQLPQKANLELDQAAVKAITESRAKAEGAVGTIAAINRQKEALDKGIVAGWGADWRTKARAATAQILGIPDSYVTNSQLFDQAATQKSAELAKAISQAGHTTNMDLQLGKTISSGDRSSVEQALRAGIEAQEVLAKTAIDRHNASVDRFATPETAQRAGFFKVEQPEVYQYRPAAPDRVALEAEMRRRGMMR